MQAPTTHIQTMLLALISTHTGRHWRPHAGDECSANTGKMFQWQVWQYQLCPLRGATARRSFAYLLQ